MHLVLLSRIACIWVKILMKIFTKSYCCPLVWMLHSKNISLIKLTVSMKKHIESLILTIHVVYSEILKQLDMELKPYHICHLKFGARFLKLSKWTHLEKPECVCRPCLKYLQRIGFVNFISAVINVFLKLCSVVVSLIYFLCYCLAIIKVIIETKYGG